MYYQFIFTAEFVRNNQREIYSFA